MLEYTESKVRHPRISVHYCIRCSAFEQTRVGQKCPCAPSTSRISSTPAKTAAHPWATPLRRSQCSVRSDTYGLIDRSGCLFRGPAFNENIPWGWCTVPMRRTSGNTCCSYSQCANTVGFHTSMRCTIWICFTGRIRHGTKSDCGSHANTRIHAGWSVGKKRTLPEFRTPSNKCLFQRAN